MELKTPFLFGEVLTGNRSREDNDTRKLVSLFWLACNVRTQPLQSLYTLIRSRQSGSVHMQFAGQRMKHYRYRET